MNAESSPHAMICSETMMEPSEDLSVWLIDAISTAFEYSSSPLLPRRDSTPSVEFRRDESFLSPFLFTPAMAEFLSCPEKSSSSPRLAVKRALDFDLIMAADDARAQFAAATEGIGFGLCGPSSVCETLEPMGDGVALEEFDDAGAEEHQKKIEKLRMIAQKRSLELASMDSKRVAINRR